PARGSAMGIFVPCSRPGALQSVYLTPIRPAPTAPAEPAPGAREEDAMPVSRRSFLGRLAPAPARAAVSPAFVAARGREALMAGAAGAGPAPPGLGRADPS